ncbi:hypothetical protein ACUNV4_25740 [Granulosicoccus sp. 3-233]|uniref:hypothetical protein n=1 Tax=Granulosicoccus sp. 3-233 TaxID=3417969 RepID=UPI003D34903F
MNVFDMLAEQRYLDWEKKVSAPGYQPPPPVSKTAIRKSYEGYVYGEVLAHLDKAAETDNTRKQQEYLQKARQLELQLVILLEKRNMPHAMTTLRHAIRLRRQAVLERARSTPASASAKPAT